MPFKWQPALVGGLFIGVLSALPILKYGNLCCCLWVIAGGLIAAYLAQQASPGAISVGDGALGGMVAGAVGAVISTVLSVFFSLLLGPLTNDAFRRIVENNPDLPPQFRDMLSSGAAPALLQVATFFVALVVYVIFGTIGGMIGAAIFGRGKPTVMPPTYQPPPYQPPPSYIPPSPPSPPPPPPPPPTEPPQ